MTEKELEKLDKKQTKEMLDEIDKNYSDLELPIAKPKYDKDGNLKNEKEVKKSLKLLLPIFIVLWNDNISVSTASSVVIMNNTNIYSNTLKATLKMPKKSISNKQWEVMMKQIVKERQKKIKIKQVINGNAKILNKQVQRLVNDMYKNGKSWVQTSKALQKQFGYNKNKAKSIAITEKNYYKSEAQLQTLENVKDDIIKIWVHNGAKDPRANHLNANGQIADKKGYFHIDGKKTKAPQHFGIPSEDINCHCTMRVETK